MKKEEALTLKRMVEGIWPSSANQPTEADIVWIVMLEEENFILCYEAIKHLIRQRKVFQPRLGEIIATAEIAPLSFENIQTPRIREMYNTGYLGNMDDKKIQDTIRKTIIWEQKKVPPWMANRRHEDMEAKTKTCSK